MQCRYYLFPFKHPIFVERFFFSLQLMKIPANTVFKYFNKRFNTRFGLNWDYTGMLCVNTQTYPNSKFCAILVSHVTSHPFSRPNSSWILEKTLHLILNWVAILKESTSGFSKKFYLHCWQGVTDSANWLLNKGWLCNIGLTEVSYIRWTDITTVVLWQCSKFCRTVV